MSMYAPQPDFVLPAIRGRPNSRQVQPFLFYISTQSTNLKKEIMKTLKIAILVISLAAAGSSIAAGMDAMAGMPASKAQPSSNANADFTEGEVRAVNKETGKVTLKHGEIKNLDMPGMTMVFGQASWLGQHHGLHAHPSEHVPDRGGVLHQRLLSFGPVAGAGPCVVHGCSSTQRIRDVGSGASRASRSGKLHSGPQKPGVRCQPTSCRLAIPIGMGRSSAGGLRRSENCV